MIAERLKQARLLADLTQAQFADELTKHDYEITKAAISKYENNKSTPSAQFLLLASQILDVPGSYFTHEPAGHVEWLAFRRHVELPKKEQETIKGYAVDIAELQIELQDMLYPNTQYTLPARESVSSFEQAEAMAQTLRQEWNLGDHPIHSLVQMLENQQIVVITWQKNGGQFDGLSGWCDNRPVTVVGTDVSIDRQRFSLAHELGHLLMDTDDVDSDTAEKLVNRFAAALLVPADRAYHELGTRRNTLDMGELGVLKQKYGLSMAGWIHRANDLDIISRNHADTLHREIKDRGWRIQEPVDYESNEAPVQLRQMARRAIAEGLMSVDRIERVCPNCLEVADLPSDDHITVYDLMAMSAEERQATIDRAFELAADDDFELLEAFDDEDFNDSAF